MIKVTFKRTKSMLVSFHVYGHAEYFDVKQNTTVYDDVVCGSVSNLAQVTILGVLEVYRGRGKHSFRCI